MRTIPKFIAALALVAAHSARADAPIVVVDIPPVFALVSAVMEGAGTPELLLAPGASPHDFSMRPSQAQALNAADLIVWIGHSLTPWMEKPLESLGEGATQLELLTLQETHLLAAREDALFHHGHDGHEDQEDHDAHDDHEGHADHDQHDHEGHGAGGIDPHAWLDPHNAEIWVSALADTLSQLDPENASLYESNSARAIAAIERTNAQITHMLEPVRGRPFLVLHDAFQYFEHAFDITPLGAIAAGDANAPGPARLRALKDAVEQSDLTCVFTEPQMPVSMINPIVGSKSVEIRTLDPLGDKISGVEGYTDMLRAVAHDLRDCLLK